LNPGVVDFPGGAITVTFDTDPVTMALMNSRNHRGLRGTKEGQNVCFVDGHVEFKDTAYCGPTRTDLNATTKTRDNIFTANTNGASSESGQTADKTSHASTKEDAVLLPAAK